MRMSVYENDVTEVPLVYFGKVPGRGDFVRSAQTTVLITALDRWLSGGIERMVDDSRWRIHYDRAVPVRFAQLGVQSRVGLAGYLIASHDASGRRFPFVTAVPIEIQEPLSYLARSPLMLESAWQQLEIEAQRAFTATEVSPLLSEFSQVKIPQERNVANHQDELFALASQHTVGSLQGLLKDSGHDINVRQTILSLGLLLAPLLGGGIQRLDKGLTLPLSRDPLYRSTIATYWIELISGFIANTSFELSLFMPSLSDEAPPVLKIGFEGSSSRTLQAILDGDLNNDYFIDACRAEWVEDYISQDFGVSKLSSYLSQDDMSLFSVGKTFKEVFHGS